MTPPDHIYQDSYFGEELTILNNISMTHPIISTKTATLAKNLLF
jgi:hypothetical protein